MSEVTVEYQMMCCGALITSIVIEIKFYHFSSKQKSISQNRAIFMQVTHNWPLQKKLNLSKFEVLQKISLKK